MQSQASAESGPVTYHAGKEAIYKYRPVAESLSLLGRLLDLYWLGLQQPLYFFPHSSFVYARELHNGKTEVEALRKAEQQWHGDGFRKTGEKYDPYNRICCRNLNLADPQFKEQAKSVFLPALDHRTKLNLHALQKDPENR